MELSLPEDRYGSWHHTQAHRLKGSQHEGPYSKVQSKVSLLLGNCHQVKAGVPTQSSTWVDTVNNQCSSDYLLWVTCVKNFHRLLGACINKSCCARLAPARSHVTHAWPQQLQIRLNPFQLRRPWLHSWSSRRCQTAPQVSRCWLSTFCPFLPVNWWQIADQDACRQLWVAQV